MFRRLLLPLLVFLIVVGGLGAFLLQKITPEIAPKDFLTIRTNILPELREHAHETKDSLFDHAKIIWGNTLVPEDLWITGFRWQLNNGPYGLVHHMRLLNLQENRSYQGPFCQTMQMLLTRSGEHANMNEVLHDFPEGYGLFVKKGTTLQVRVMLHNPSPPQGPGETYSNLSHTLFVLTRPGSIKLKTVQPIFLHLTDVPCHPFAIFTVPPASPEYIKRSDEKLPSTMFVFPKDGEVLVLGGHFHPRSNGGPLSVYINGKKFHTFEARRMIRDGIPSWAIRSLVGNPRVLEVKAGDVLTYEVGYANPGPNPIPDAMGMVGIYFAPKE